MHALIGVVMLVVAFGAGMQGTGIAANENGERRNPRGERVAAEESVERESDTDSIRLLVPVAGVRARDLADTWGGIRPEGRSHEGIDIFAERNTPVLSATDGRIIRQGVSERGGNVVWIYGVDGRRHYYAHLEKHSDHSVGDRIRAGDTIGYVGNSGNAQTTPTHLHYGIYTFGGAINPYPLLSGGK